MTGTALAEAFTREHHEIDAGIQAYLDGLDSGGSVAPLQTAMHALRRHIYLEERFMFPPLREAGLMMPILVMLKEHGELWRRMDELDVALADGDEPGELRPTMSGDAGPARGAQQQGGADRLPQG